MSEQTERFLKKPSEFGGKKTDATHGIQKEVDGHENLTATERLRLTYRTGQDDTAEAPDDPHAWTGG